ncbi:hypothetical protein HYU17_04670 [Candidatus Woesearchaeota archaeon]|nr:hypothetical protein [Candidatus Woesearchaeota archaeon]
MVHIPIEGHIFFLIGLVLGFLSSICALYIAAYTFRGYLLTRNRASMFFSASFFLLGFGLLGRTLFNYINVAHLPGLFNFIPQGPFQDFLAISSIFLVNSGYIMLTALFFRITSKRVTLLLFVLLALLTVSSQSAYLTGQVLPVILLAFVLTHAIENLFKKKTANAFLVLSSFALLFVSDMFFLLIPESIIFYFVGNSLRLLAYLQLLANIWLVLKHDIKKGKA